MLHNWFTHTHGQARPALENLQSTFMRRSAWKIKYNKLCLCETNKIEDSVSRYLDINEEQTLI